VFALTFYLKWQIVRFHLLESSLRIALRLRLRLRLRLLIPWRNELDLLRINIHIRVSLPVLPRVGADAHCPDNGNLAAFGEVFRAIFAHFAPCVNPEEIRFRLLALLGLAAVNRDSKTAYAEPGRGGSEFRILGQIADDS